MKPFMFLLLSFIILKISYAQTGASEFMVMSVEKKSSSDNNPVILKFKPERVLKIKTSEGKELKSANYVYQDDAIVMISSTAYGKEKTDTIPFRNIVKVRGKVYGNTLRKAGGTILALTGLPVATGGYVFGALLSDTAAGGVLMMFPGFLLTGSGIRITGARNFNTKNKWIIKTTPSDNYQNNQENTAGS